MLSLRESAEYLCEPLELRTRLPAIGVQKPATSRIPVPTKSMAGIVTFSGGGSLNSVKLARRTSADPTTRRIRSNPVPGQPPANVEYRRRKDAPFRTTFLSSAVLKPHRTPKRVRSSLFRVLGFETWAASWGWNLQLDDPSLQTDHRRLGPVVGAQLGENVLDSPLDRLLGDRQLIGNLLIGISGCN